ncbi:MAG: hypothetical protein IJ965_07855 [Campylobacter sp.]|nr:hypothetical protein [Campylobacter sp.]
MKILNYIFGKDIKIKNYIVGCSGSLYNPAMFESQNGFIYQKSTKKIIEAQRQ